MFEPDGTKTIRRGRPVPRGNALPPCRLCPKKSPEQAHQYELSRKNQKAYRLYQITRACGGANLTEEQRSDAIVQRNLAIIDGIVRAHEADAQAALVAVNLSAMLMPSSAAPPAATRRTR